MKKETKNPKATLRKVSDNVPDIIYSLNPKGEFISLSPSVKSTMGYRPSELIGKSVFQIIHPGDREKVKETFIKSVKTGDTKVKTIRFRMNTKSGKTKHFEIRRKMVLKNGQMIRNDGIARDITHAVQLEEKLKQYHEDMAQANLDLIAIQEKLEKKNQEMKKLLADLSKNKDELQNIIDVNPYAILMVDNSGTIKVFNKRVIEYFGPPVEKIINSSFDKFIAKIRINFEDTKLFNTLIENLKKKPDTSEHIGLAEIFKRGIRIIKHKKGVISPTCYVMRDKSRKKIGHLWIFVDISFLKHAEEQVHTIVESSPIPTIITRLEDGKIQWANQELADLIGLTTEELIGQVSPDFYYLPEDRKLVVDGLKRDGFLRNFETQIKKADGSVIWMIFSLVITQMNGENVIIGWLYDISERKIAEEALTKERNFVSAVLKTESALVIVLDTQGRIIRFNMASEHISGYTLDEVRGKVFWDFLLLPEEIDRVKEVFNDLKSGKFPNKTENFWVAKNGDQRLISWSNSVLLDDTGSVEYIIGTGTDITEHRHAEEAVANRLKYEEGLAACSKALMKESETEDALLEALMHLNKASNTSSVYILENYVDPKKGLCARLTHQVCPTCKIAPEDSSLPHQFAYSQGLDRWKKLLSQGKPIGGSLEMFPESERTFLESLGALSILIIPLRVEGKWYGLIGFEDNENRREWSEEDIRLLQTAADIVDDYIERKKFQETLRLSEERFRSLVENAKDIIFSMTAKGTITYLSPKFHDLLGYKTLDFIGQSFTKLMHPDDIDKSVKEFQTGLKQGQSERGLEFRMKHQDGSIRWFITNSSNILDENGKIMEVVGVAHDITDMKVVLDNLAQTNETLRETQSQLVQSEKMAALGSLVAGIAHEINTPIGAVSSMYDTLFRALAKLKDTLESKFPKEFEPIPNLKATYDIINDSAKVIKSGTDRVTKIVRRLKSFARLDEAEIKDADINEGLEDTLTLIHHELKQNIEVKKNYGAIPLISCFPGQLNQVFLNLFINGKQAIKGKGIIEISTSVKYNKVHIVVKDNGSGISKQNLTKIFDPGFTTKGRGVGAGLGLSICYQIMQAHRGEIKVESTLGKGTTFTVILPMDLENILENEKKVAKKNDRLRLLK